MSDNAVEIKNISKIYRVYEKPHHRILEILTRHKKAFHFTSAALENVSVNIKKGAVFGIVGKNGSGKSTLLQIIASVLQPTSGSVTVRGRVSALLELGSGFNPDFTGIENIYLYGSILGISKSEMQSKMSDIIRFANIGEYIHLPTKTYSSGMVVRLAFATAVAVDPEILIVDEALSVGDAEFQHRCILRIREIIQRGATVIFVSHDIGTVKLLCEQAILLEKGKLVAFGTADEVAKEYHRRLFNHQVENDIAPQGSDFSLISPKETDTESVFPVSDHENPPLPSPQQLEEFRQKNSPTQFGTGEASIIFCALLDSNGVRTTSIEFLKKMTVRLYIKFHAPCRSAVAGIVIRNSTGVDIITTNTHIEQSNLTNIQANEVRVVDFSFTNTLRDDHYSINPAVCSEEYFHQARPFHWIDNALIFSTSKPRTKIVYNLFYPESMSLYQWNLGTLKDKESISQGGT